MNYIHTLVHQGYTYAVYTYVPTYISLHMYAYLGQCSTPHGHLIIRECGNTLYLGMAQGVSFSLYIGIGAKFQKTQKTGERRLRRAEYRTALL